MFIVWTVYSSLPVTPSTVLPFTSNGRQKHRLAPIAIERTDGNVTSISRLHVFLPSDSHLKIYLSKTNVSF